jgi:TonB family protein
MNQKTGTEYRLLRWLHRSGRPGCLAVMILHAALCFPQAAAPKFWAYVGPQYVITAEAAGSYGVVLNFINLTDFVIVVQPNEFIYKGSSGRFYIGQVFDHESQDNRGETFKYSASILLKGHSFTGLTVLGAFHEQDAVDELSVRIGAKRYYLVPLEKVEFEQLAARIGELDLENASPRAALQDADLNEMGSVKTTDGTSDWDKDWQGLLQPDGLNFPKIVARPPVQPTEEARKSRTYGKVKLSALITRNGGIEDLRVERGLGRGLDERAMESVRNSWVFLPATKNGEVLEGRVAFEVVFPAPPKE